jgi:hypothetical protein
LVTVAVYVSTSSSCTTSWFAAIVSFRSAVEVDDTATNAANSDVLPAPSVAVAVMRSPAAMPALGSVSANQPLLAVVAVPRTSGLRRNPMRRRRP